ncbi:MAG: AEC family transporter [Acetatifactor sp.]|nr:AEC family transporter [Acetatifactor sp.]
MVDSFIYAFQAITPVVLLIALGFFLKELAFYDEVFLKQANRLVFYVFLPVMLYMNIYEVADLGEINWMLTGYVMLIVLGLFLFSIGVVLLWVPDHKQRGVVMQCIFRSNYAIIGLSFAQALSGSKAVAVVGVLSAFTIPLYNVLAVLSMSIFMHERKEKTNFKEVAKKIMHNPLIIGCLLGLGTLLIRQYIPTDVNGHSCFSIREDGKFFYSFLAYLAKASTPVALIVLGGRFDFKAVKGLWKQISIGVVGRLIIAPILGIGVAYLISSQTGLLNLGTAEYAALVGLFASPVAVSIAVMAEEMDNDAVLAGQYVVWTNIGAIFTVFVTVVVMRMMGLLM